MSTVFIYALNDPETNLARYIGKAQNPKLRLSAHLTDRRICHRTNWIKGLAARGLTPVVEILEETTSEGWEERERYFIRVFREMGFDLVNMTDGGEGQSKGYSPSDSVREKNSAAHKGRKRSQETKDKIAASKRGKKRAPFSEECKKKMSESHTGDRHHLFGKHHSEETKAKIGLAHSGANHPLFGKHLPESTKLKISIANKGKKTGFKHSESFGRLVSQRLRERWAKIRESKKGQPACQVEFAPQ